MAVSRYDLGNELPRHRANGPGLTDLYWRSIHGLSVSRRRMTCSVCGGPLRRDNKTGICDRNPECHCARARLAYVPASWTFRCVVCSDPIRDDNKSGVCQRNPECRREHDRRRHITHRTRRLAAQKQYRDRPGRHCRYWAAGCTEDAIIGGHACREHALQERRSLYEAHRTDLIRSLADAQGWICTWEHCWQPILPGDQLEIDHIIPISSGSVIRDEWNLQVLHWNCNRAKGTLVTDRSVRLASEHGIELTLIGS